MTTIYNRIENNFTQVSNKAILDNRITGKAYKLYSYMVMRIGNCPTWEFNQKEIAKHFNEKRDAIYAAFDELIECGWLVRKRTRTKGGLFGKSEFEIFASPQITESPPCPENPDMVKPDMDKPDTENPDYNKERLEREKDINNTNSTNKNIKPPLPPIEEKVGFKKFEGGVNKLVSMLSDKALDLAKKNAPGWSIYYLMEIYIEGINKRGFPDDINKAFPAWCTKYTKGKRPN